MYLGSRMGPPPPWSTGMRNTPVFPMLSARRPRFLPIRRPATPNATPAVSIVHHPQCNYVSLSGFATPIPYSMVGGFAIGNAHCLSLYQGGYAIRQLTTLCRPVLCSHNDVGVLLSLLLYRGALVALTMGAHANGLSHPRTRAPTPTRTRARSSSSS